MALVIFGLSLLLLNHLSQRRNIEK
jgi:hypothetical protein